MVETGNLVKNDNHKRGINFASRVVIEHVQPEIDAGKFAIKRVIGEPVQVMATIHTDGHNALKALLLYRHENEQQWSEIEMMPVGQGLDLFGAEFAVDRLGYYEYTIHAWIDNFGNWRRDTAKKLAAGQPVEVEIIEGRQLFAAAIKNAGEQDKQLLEQFAGALQSPGLDASAPLFADKTLDRLMLNHSPRGRVATYERVLKVMVEPVYALYGSWYELFPRSCTDDVTRHGTFDDVIKRLPEIEQMGFDVLYLPPIHPIGVTKRKGKNNTLVASETDPGSPWAIGAAEGGHTSVHPQLGTLEKFSQLVKAAEQRGIRIALDIAYQCSPDHPWVKEHPEWFYHRPDGTIKYAENPPKKYEDIYPLNFECEDWEAMWEAMTDVLRFWVKQGVRIFRIDNPHTKPYLFWKYAIEIIKSENPDVIFLSEAFSRPPVMKQLAKCGFSQSYTYFTWRTAKHELTEYLTELTTTPTVEYLRPNFFANTPDILPENLQHGGRNSFILRAVLASTLSATYGIYGPAYELCQSAAVPGTEEYLNSEKYEIYAWNTDDPASIDNYLARLNQIRRQHPALQNNRSLRFLDIDNRELIAYCKIDEKNNDLIIVVVNLDPYNAQSGNLTLPLAELGIGESYQVHDLITERRYRWVGETNFVSIAPGAQAYIFHVRKHLRTEHDFDYFM